MRKCSGKFSLQIPPRHDFFQTGSKDDGYDYKWFCANQENISLRGNYWTATYEGLFFDFTIKEEYCVANNTNLNLDCGLKPEHELLVDKLQFMIVSNTKRFDQEDYVSDSSIHSQADLSFFFFPTSRIHRMLHLEETVLKRNDNTFMATTGMTDIEETFFSISPYDFHTRTWQPQTRLTVEI